MCQKLLNALEVAGKDNSLFFSIFPPPRECEWGGFKCDFPEVQKKLFHIFHFLENNLCFKSIKDHHKKGQQHASLLYYKRILPDTSVQV
jgi:hypothetical protein